ncbi:MAG TPA: ABC transporter ATP-binding protein [Chloroflexota bacterium]|nr:ABC transporter ATP-binding protein [Chloroflexota bacterium]
MLQAEQLTKRFGGLVAVNQVSFEVADGELVGIIGPNGAGKSTLFNLIAGVYRPDSGQVRLDGKAIDHLRPHERVRLGLARTFQGALAFPNLTVLENVMVGRQTKAMASVFELMLRLPRGVSDEDAIARAAGDQLQLVELPVPGGAPASILTAGQQRLLAIARALATEPRLLLLDEPAAGLNPNERQQLAAIIRKLHAGGMTILLVEHDVDFVMGLAERIVVLDYGRKLAEGSPDQVRSNMAVIAAYLGAD